MTKNTAPINDRRPARTFAICCMLEVALADNMPAIGHLVRYCEGRATELSYPVVDFLTAAQVTRLQNEVYRLKPEDYSWLNEYEPDRRLIALIRSWSK